MSVHFGFPEWLSTVFFAFFLLLAWFRPIDRWRRISVTGLGATAIGLQLILLTANDGELTAFRTVLPLLLMPMAYWQTGLFNSPLNRRLQEQIAAVDDIFLAVFKKVSLPYWLQRGLSFYVELAYLLVYPMVPSGLLVLYLAGALDHATEFWTVVLPPAYVCYATLPFFRTLPPRRLMEEPREQIKQTAMRGFNLNIVRLVTHQANTFPSGHAAAATAVALVLLRVTPTVGIIFLIIALSIMVGAFVGRYHYMADIVLGVALACIAFALAF